MKWDILQDPTLASHVCLVLLHSLWIVTLLALLARIAERLVGQKAVQRSYAIHVTALIAAILALPATYWLIAPPDDMTATVETPFAEATTAQFVEPVGVMPPSTEAPLATTAAAQTPVTPPTVEVLVPEPPEAAPNRDLWPIVARWLATAYALGVLGMLLRLIRGVCHAQRLGARADILRDGPLIDLLRSLAEQWSMRVVPTLAQAEQIVTPKVVGLLRPTILLPASAVTGLSTDELELILAHELAHIRRYDMWVNLVQRLAEALLFFNPALWYLSRRISLLREYCCDEAACAGAHCQVRYAQALLRSVELAGSGRDQAELATLAATARTPSQLRRRVARLFGEPLAESIRFSRGGLILIGVMAVLMLVGPTWHTSAKAPDDAASPREDSNEVSPPESPSPTTTYPVNKKVSDFPAADDFSTPEAAYATINRKCADGPLDWNTVSCRRTRDSIRPGVDVTTPRPSDEDAAIMRGAEILEVRIYDKTFAQVAARRQRKNRPIDLRSFELEDGRWLNAGNDKMETIDEAAGNFERLVKWREEHKNDPPHRAGDVVLAKPKDVPLSKEKLDLMGRVEWVLMHNGRDVTARKTIEWGDVEKHADGSRSLRYKFQATIWDRDQMIMNMVFTFDPDGKVVGMKQVGGFPKKVDNKVNSKIILSDGDRSITAESITFESNSGNWRITAGSPPVATTPKKVDDKVKPRVTLSDGDRSITAESITLKRDSDSWRITVEGSPGTQEPKKVDTTTKEGMIALVEDFFSKNFRDVTKREKVQWGEPTKTKDGNVSIRCIYVATIWGKDKKTLDQVFTFTPQGKYVSVADARQTANER